MADSWRKMVVAIDDIASTPLDKVYLLYRTEWLGRLISIDSLR